jgi:hypothetical protein
MLVRDADGKIVIVSRKDYSTDKGYYQKISTFRKGGAKFPSLRKMESKIGNHIRTMEQKM